MAETPRRPRHVEEFIAAYEEADAATRADRAERAAWLAGLGWPESGWQFFGGDPTASWEELRRTFIDGSYLATILVGHVFLENLLAGQLASDVLKRTRDRGWLGPDEFEVLDALREMRNPYAHYAEFLQETPEAVVEQDARAVVEALYRLVNRPPFALGPILYPDHEEVHPDQMHLPL
jgi:hypothetical protein